MNIKYLLPTRLFLSLKFFKNFHRLPNLSNPQTFNEKLQWLKLHNRRPIYTQMVDKLQAKTYVANIIGPQYIIPTLASWSRAEDIDFDSLPDKFVLKTTHDSGRVIICHDKSKLDRPATITQLNKALKRDFYAITREWPYKNVPRRIIAEQLLEPDDPNNPDLKDYKFFCFNGEAKFFKIDFNRSTHHQANYYDLEGNLLKFGETVCPPDFNIQLKQPISLAKMISLANELSKNIPFVRVDFYEVNGQPYFGELTFFPNSGMGPFTDPNIDSELGKLISLPILPSPQGEQ